MNKKRDFQPYVSGHVLVERTSVLRVRPLRILVTAVLLGGLWQNNGH